MPDAALAAEPQVASLDARLDARRVKSETSPTRTLVARRYGRRDWFLRRLLAASDIGSLAIAMVLAMALAGGARDHAWTQFAVYGLATLPAWVVVFAMYALSKPDPNRLHPPTL